MQVRLIACWVLDLAEIFFFFFYQPQEIERDSVVLLFPFLWVDWFRQKSGHATLICDATKRRLNVLKTSWKAFFTIPLLFQREPIAKKLQSKLQYFFVTFANAIVPRLARFSRNFALQLDSNLIFSMSFAQNVRIPWLVFCGIQIVRKKLGIFQCLLF